MHPLASRLPISKLMLAPSLLAVSIGIITASQLAAQESNSQRPWIDPEGHQGTLLVLGDQAPSAGWQAFFRLASRQPDRPILALVAGPHAQSADLLGTFTDEWLQQSDFDVRLVRIKEIEQDDADVARKQLASQIAEAGSIILLGNNSTEPHPTLRDPKGLEQLLAQLSAGKLIATCQTDPQLLFTGSADSTATQLGALPEAKISLSSQNLVDELPESFRQHFETRPQSIGIEMAQDSAFVCTGRRVYSLSEGKVRVTLAESSNKPAQSFILPEDHRMLDSVALRRAAWDRVGDKFPPDAPNTPHVPNGTLILIGGGGMPSGIISRFVELAGGKESVILVLPTAMPDPLPNRQRIADSFKRAGAGEVHVLSGRKREDVESDEYRELTQRATGIWFGGGRQWRFVDAYQDSELEPLMHGVLTRGGVIMGSSAGASIQAEYMARGTPIGNTQIMADGYEKGLGFLPGAAVDQHFRQRNRFGDMKALVDRYPQILGIGIDESTAIEVQGSIATVSGRGATHFFDAQKSDGEDNDEPLYESVWTGGSYDLAERSVIDAGEEPQPERSNEEADGQDKLNSSSSSSLMRPRHLRNTTEPWRNATRVPR